VRLRETIARVGVWLLRPALETMIDRHRLWVPLVVGSRERLTIATSAVVGDATLNVMSGTITIEEHVFFGQHVMIAAGTHDHKLFGRGRFEAVPENGYDVVIREGAWVASGSIVIGPCEIGEHAVIAAGSVVRDDVAPYTMVAGVPARVVRFLARDDEPQ
jgi:acetyltransferase-like isoleucine patch superfamily enzyme